MTENKRVFHSLSELQAYLKAYAVARDWEQFHSPKNLVMALSVEAAELTEHFQWLSEEASGRLNADKKAQVADEMADIMMYLVRLADVVEVDLLSACASKSIVNETKYPAEKVKGSARKYSDYQD